MFALIIYMNEWDFGQNRISSVRRIGKARDTDIARHFLGNEKRVQAQAIRCDLITSNDVQMKYVPDARAADAIC